MTRRLHPLLSLAMCVCLPGTMTPAPAKACVAIAQDPGVNVQLGAEDVVIVWDEQAKRQHFIRRVQFDTDTDAFAFLVPTPSVPTLSETPEEVFGVLAAEAAPRVERQNPWQVGTCFSMTLAGSAPGDGTAVSAFGSDDVRVIGTQRVAGLDASILEVRDPAALPRWLEENGYPQTPAVMEWVQPYVAQGFVVTAFKFHKDEDKVRLLTSAVRMSFDADEPFYPYREPPRADASTPTAMKVFFLAPQRASAMVGQSAWSADLVYSSQLSGTASHSILGSIDHTELREEYWLTVFEDHSTVRPDHDIIFSSAEGQEVLPPPRIITGAPTVVPIPVELILPAGLFWFVRRRLKQRRSERDDGDAP